MAEKRVSKKGGLELSCKIKKTSAKSKKLSHREEQSLPIYTCEVKEKHGGNRGNRWWPWGVDQSETGLEGTPRLFRGQSKKQTAERKENATRSKRQNSLNKE